MSNVYLFWPNIIGYARIVFGAVSMFYMRNSPIVAMVLYSTSSLLDAFDGYIARLLDQGSYSCASINKRYKIWSCTGYGDRSLSYSVSSSASCTTLP